ncbi:hypothetical protein ATL17_2514 [Maritalea mobilis]|uniref:Uncharacterized protein n=1 Tax=Maritalea mobilis TaxID=483324 RepID=A0A4V6PX43_9HYPH|nr:hypothetical protein [Maritalea mobilis]TDQ64494.1 hypothetical protein ATL17_2514 [Maritalea mobilis]
MQILQLDSVTLLVLATIALVLYAIARMMSARWPVALTFSTMPLVVFIFHTGQGGRLLAGMF